MKFAEHLQQEIFPPWKLSYISYDVLKNDLKSRQLDHTWNQQDEQEFVRKLDNELEKVYDFVTAKLVSRIAGALFIGISAGIAIYALYQFERRAWMINRRIVGRYDDLWGPAVLCVLLVAALIVNFYLRFR
ncbi:hypothetical protein RMATCC62417_13452 [Rhizopus microsporus]|nr:hypothetical protein RMATCC62417_13452 [Rhizopus microsporus]